MSEALRLAEALDDSVETADEWSQSQVYAAAAELRRLADVEAQRDELLEALRALMALDVKGHALADRLQFSDAGRALLHQCQAAIEKAEQETT